MEDTEIKQEMDKLEDIFKDIPTQKQKLVSNLIQNAAFMAVTLRALQEDIDTNGAVIYGTNGNGFEVSMENPAQKSYNTMINRYTSVIKQLQDLLPDAKQDAVNQAGNELAAFIVKGKK